MSIFNADKIIYVIAEGNYSTFYFANKDKRVYTLQLGEIEERLAMQLDNDNNCFIRVGKSLIVNANFIYYINVPLQQLVLSDNTQFTYNLSASKEALRKLKDFIIRNFKS